MTNWVCGVYQVWIHPRANDRELLVASRLLIVLIVAIAFVAAFFLPTSIWFMQIAKQNGWPMSVHHQLPTQRRFGGFKHQVHCVKYLAGPCVLKLERDLGICPVPTIGGWRPKGFVNLALEKGYMLGFEASSDHVSTHISYCNLYVKDLTRASILDALKKRHVYAATDNILADVRSGDHLMGDSFSTTSTPSLRVRLSGTAKFAKVSIIKDNAYVYSTNPGTAEVQFSWIDNSPVAGKTSYYYVRGEQEDGQIVWVSPMWIAYQPKR